MTATTLTEALTAGMPDLSRGLCVGHQDLFGAVDDPGLVDHAISLCQQCPVLAACREWADTLAPNDLHGVVAGRVYEWRKPSLLRKEASS